MLDSLDIVTITLHADGKTSKYRGFHETRSETSTQEFTLTGGQGGSLTGSTFGMGMFNSFHRDKTTSLTESTNVDGVLTRDETITLEAGNSGSTSFSFSLSNDGLSLSFSGGNSFLNSEESTTVNGVRTAYEAIKGTQSHHSMSLGFDYEDAFVIFGFLTTSSSNQGQKTTRTLEANGAMSQRVERDGGGSHYSRTHVEVLLPGYFWWSPNGTYSSEQISSSSWTIDGDFSSAGWHGLCPCDCEQPPHARWVGSESSRPKCPFSRLVAFEPQGQWRSVWHLCGEMRVPVQPRV